ncbi:hypothetical protein [Hydrogenophaga pseudoflava]|uniref:hypothetical protein n=1 Tax=Hydrogenophaga pseudoflava TaxID=47421 RepID=UPI0027E432BA|nr:hypothetical protein [Hydrogenophaga pseudoflava]MDQ7746271.1 hypothetical protein [Hydrogenophaga pseudoflava]
MHDRDTLSQTDQLSTLHKPRGRRVRIALYVGLCLVASLVPLFLESARAPHGDSGVAEMLGAIGGLLALAVLTFPAGVVAVPLWWLLVWNGIATPSEGVAAVMPVFTVAGYLQWFVLVPKLARRGSKAASR